MSSAEVAVRAFRQLENEDLRTLQIIETSMSRREFVPVEQIVKFSELPMDRVKFILNKLDKLGFIYRVKGAYVGHTLNYAGYDCLAINAFVKAGLIDAFGKSLGVGKEADVFEALTPKSSHVAVKFHRLGRISFRQTRRKRGYTAEHAAWLFQSRLAAEKEFQALKIVYENGVAVPKPLSQNRHAIVMGFIDGAELANWRRLENPEKVLRTILRNVRNSYTKACVVHADLSEYNIILKGGQQVLIIDWPQFVTTDHPNAGELLERDVKNILSFFSRRFRVKIEPAKVVAYVSGKTRSFKLSA
ncbi:MAG TPA: RIO1 family regulatory kinase/ATPase [Candidatus Bathyarchaeia archaeon]